MNARPTAPTQPLRPTIDTYLSQLKKPGDEIVMPLSPNARANHVRHWCEVRAISIKTTTKGVPAGMLRVTCVRHVAHENEQRAFARRALEAAGLATV